MLRSPEPMMTRCPDSVYLRISGQTVTHRTVRDIRLASALRVAYSPIGGEVTVAGLRGTLTEQGQAVLKALGSGDLAPEEAARVLGALADQARIVEVVELERRVQALEKRRVTR
jgi:hypothetical protein